MKIISLFLKILRKGKKFQKKINIFSEISLFLESSETYGNFCILKFGAKKYFLLYFWWIYFFIRFRLNLITNRDNKHNVHKRWLTCQVTLLHYIYIDIYLKISRTFYTIIWAREHLFHNFFSYCCSMATR